MTVLASIRHGERGASAAILRRSEMTSGVGGSARADNPRIESFAAGGIHLRALRHSRRSGSRTRSKRLLYSANYDGELEATSPS